MKSILFLVALILSSVAHAADLPRVAVVPDSAESSVAAFADFLSVSLASASNQYTLVERAEITRLASEAEVQKLAADQRPAALAKLAKADGIIIVGADKGDPKLPKLTLRLTSTNNGLVLRSLILGGKEDEYPKAAELAAGVLRFPCERLTHGDSKQPVIVSLLGIRPAFEIDRALETTLNLAVAQQLSAQSGIVVSERWRMNDLVFERSLAIKEMLPLATGAVLLDGSYHEKQDGMTITLRVQDKADANPRNILLEGLEDKPSVMALRITEALTTQLSGKAMLQWDAKEEAAQYAGLGQWLVARRMGIEAAQAFESAVALGDNSPETLVARMRAYAAVVCPQKDKLNGYDIIRHDVDGLDEMDEETFKVAIHSMIRLAGDIQLLVDSDWQGFEKSRFDPKLRKSFLRNISGLGQEVLEALHLRGEHQKHAADAATLRRICRHLIDTGKSKYGSAFYSGRDLFIGFIFDTPEEALKEYLIMFDPSRITGEGKGLRDGLWSVWKSDSSVPPLIDWSGGDQSHANTAWDGFIRELEQSKHLLNRSDALALKYQNAKDPTTRAQLLNQYFDLLDKNAVEMATPQGQLALQAFGTEWIAPRVQFDARIHRRLAEQLASIMEKADWVESVIVSSAWNMTLYWSRARDRAAREELSPVASRLLAAIDGIADSAPKHVRWKAEDQKAYLKTMDDLRQNIWKVFPDLAKSRLAPAVPDAVRIRAWQPDFPTARASHTASDYAKGDWCYSGRMRWDGSRLFVLLVGNHMVSLDPTTMKSEYFATPPRFASLSLAVAGDQMMYETGKGLFISNYRTEPGIWKETSPPDMPPIKDVGRSVFAVGNDFYVGSRIYYESQFLQHFIARYRNGTWSSIASSNRKPAQHPFDAVSPCTVLQVFPGFQGKPLLLTEDGGKRSQEVLDLESGKHIASFIWKGDFQEGGDMPLHWNVPWEKRVISHAVAFDPTQQKPRLLFRNPEEPMAKEWDKVVPEFDCRKEEALGEIIAPIIHGGRLWLLKWERPNGSVRYDPDLLRLVGFDLKSRKSVVVPLTYAVPAAIQSLNFGKGMHFSTPRIEGHSLTATGDALFFAPGNEDPSLAGVSPVLLYVRWEDIHAWISKHHPEF